LKRRLTARAGGQSRVCRVAKELGETSLMWLVHPTLTQAEMARTAAVVAQVLQQASLG
jgi:dTDP-4-amino-4,6-dideoxygalactose transaminase